MRIEDENSQRAVLVAISDDCMRKILEATMLVGKSVDEISHEKSIPVSTCYRYVHQLLALRLLRVEHTTISDSGKKCVTYRNILNSVTISMSPEQLTVNVTFHKMQQEWGSKKSFTYKPCNYCERHPDYANLSPITKHMDGVCTICGSSVSKVVELYERST